MYSHFKYVNIERTFGTLFLNSNSKTDKWNGILKVCWYVFEKHKLNGSVSQIGIGKIFIDIGQSVFLTYDMFHLSRNCIYKYKLPILNRKYVLYWSKSLVSFIEFVKWRFSITLFSCRIQIFIFLKMKMSSQVHLWELISFIYIHIFTDVLKLAFDFISFWERRCT